MGQQRQQPNSGVANISTPTQTDICFLLGITVFSFSAENNNNGHGNKSHHRERLIPSSNDSHVIRPEQVRVCDGHWAAALRISGHVK